MLPAIIFIFSLVTAAFVPPLISLIWSPYLIAFIYKLGLSLSVAAIFGIPGFLILQRTGAVNGWTSAMIGFAGGTASSAFWSWPFRQPGGESWRRIGNEMVPLMTRGIPTGRGWAEYAAGVFWVGLMGLVGGLVFWIVWGTITKRFSRRAL